MAGLAAVGGVFDAIGNIIASENNYDAQKAAANINLTSQREANEMNYKIAQEANELELQKFQENMQWLREQYYGDREYNDPRRMKDRYIEAGINPLFVMGNSANASASSAVGGASLPNIHTAHMEAPHLEPAVYDWSGISSSIGRSIDAFFQNQLVNEQAKSLETENQFKRTQIAIQLNQQIAETRKVLAEKEEILSRKNLNEETRNKVAAEKESIQQNIKLLSRQWQALEQQPYKTNKLLDAQIRNIDEETVNKSVDTALKKTELQWKPMLNAAQIRMSNQQISLIQSQIDNLAGQTANLIKEGWLTDQKGTQQYLQNEITNLLLKDKAFQYGLKNRTEFEKYLFNYTEMLSRSIFSGLAPLIK